MSKKRISWTGQQRRAIGARGSDVFVTASAGTGKTAVLSGRCVDIVSDKSLCPDVLSVLVLTFTNAAAEQMRQRIAEQLKDAFAESGDKHLRHQLVLLAGADIGTIHSFCKQLITEYFYELGIDPGFRVIESDEQMLLKTEVLEGTIAWAWEQDNLRVGLEQLLWRRDLRTGDGFLGRVIELSNFLDGVVSREDWCERAALLAGAANPFASELGKKQKQIVGEKLKRILSQLRSAQELYKEQSSGGDWSNYCEEKFIQPVAECIELFEAYDWEGCAERIRGFEKPRVNTPKEVPEEVGEIIQKTVKRGVDLLGGLCELAVLNPEYLERVGGSASLQTKIFIELVKKFDRLYSQAKRAINCFDFADLEHYALRLLRDESSTKGEVVPSEVALALRRRYKYIFVDEYQDINPVQQAILEAVSSGGNVFVVGDVKQSIYAFRGAEPKIFVNDLESASSEPVGGGGLRVDLNANFRSAEGIVAFVNKVFGRIMASSLGDIDYDESARLRAFVGEDTKKEAGPCVELHILDKQGMDVDEGDGEAERSGDEEDLGVVSSRQCQAAMVARRIREMVWAEGGKAEFEIYDKQKGEFRQVEYRDIVVLMRSPAKRVIDYVEVLGLAGVPVSSEGPSGYFERTEVADCLSLLKVLDNPQRDIELAAVLRSPFFNVSDSELARIKIQGGKREDCKNFYDCAFEYCSSGADAELAGKLGKILAELGRWRDLSRRGSLADLIWQIYRETGYLSFVGAGSNGRSRKANLLKLHERAIEFEGFASSGGIVSLRRFVEFIEKLEEAGGEWTGSEPGALGENAVRVMSVHKSKGLEFPVVFLAELEGKFNTKEVSGDFVADAEDTLGIQIIEREANSKLSSLGHQVIAEEKLAMTLAEEMRILYVATTRARERLVLCGCEKQSSCREIISRGLLFGGQNIPEWQVRSCRSFLGWILYGLCDQKSLHNAFGSGLGEKCEDEGLFGLEVYGQSEVEELCGYVRGLREGKGRPAEAKIKAKRSKEHKELLGRIKESLDWRYGYGDAPRLAAKQSVTELTHRDDEYVKIDYSRALERRPRAAAMGEMVDGRLVGTAVHLLIAQLDLGRPMTKGAIEQMKEKLVAEGAIAEAVAECIDTDSIVGFFGSELGRRVLDGDNEVWREWPFTFSVPASEVARCSGLVKSVGDDETVIVQGMIDVLVRTAEGLIVIDFKTDDIAVSEVQGRAELYREQLELYGQAAGAILNTEVVGKWLYFLRAGRAVEIKN